MYAQSRAYLTILLFILFPVALSGAVIPDQYCTQGDGHDDGSDESGARANVFVEDATIVERFTPGTTPYHYESVCFAWRRITGNPDLTFDIVIYDDDGPLGTPGTLLHAIPVVATAPSNLAHQFFSFDIRTAGVRVEQGSVYIGARWHPKVDGVITSDYSLGMDTSAGTGQQHAYYSEDDGDDWNIVKSYSVWQNYKALLIRPFGTMYDCNGNGISDPLEIANGFKPDCDGNNVPDECDPDNDGDGLIDACDICSHAADVGQENSDSDPLGDACDNCPNVANASQEDSDGNGIGDACESSDVSGGGSGSGGEGDSDGAVNGDVEPGPSTAQCCGAGFESMIAPLMMLGYTVRRRSRRTQI